MLICQMTDLHIRPPGKPANRVVETNMLVERAFRAVAAFTPRPDVVVITGDLTECGLDAEYANLARLLRKFLPMPVFVIPGNHDRRGAFREGLAHLPGVTSDPHYVQYAVEDYPVRLVMLDSLVPGAGHGELNAEQLGFLDRTLAAVPDKPTIVALHHPPFVCGIAHMDRINLRDRRRVRRSHRQAQAGGAHHLRPPPPRRSSRAWRTPSPRSRRRWRTRWSWSLIRTRRAPSCSSRRRSSCTAGRRPTGSCRTPPMSSIIPDRIRS